MDGVRVRYGFSGNSWVCRRAYCRVWGCRLFETDQTRWISPNHVDKCEIKSSSAQTYDCSAVGTMRDGIISSPNYIRAISARYSFNDLSLLDRLHSRTRVAHAISISMEGFRGQ